MAEISKGKQETASKGQIPPPRLKGSETSKIVKTDYLFDGPAPRGLPRTSRGLRVPPEVATDWRAKMRRPVVCIPPTPFGAGRESHCVERIHDLMEPARAAGVVTGGHSPSRPL